MRTLEIEGAQSARDDYKCKYKCIDKCKLWREDLFLGRGAFCLSPRLTCVYPSISRRWVSRWLKRIGSVSKDWDATVLVCDARKYTRAEKARVLAAIRGRRKAEVHHEQYSRHAGQKALQGVPGGEGELHRQLRGIGAFGEPIQFQILAGIDPYRGIDLVDQVLLARCCREGVGGRAGQPVIRLPGPRKLRPGQYPDGDRLYPDAGQRCGALLVAWFVGLPKGDNIAISIEVGVRNGNLCLLSQASLFTIAQGYAPAFSDAVLTTIVLFAGASLPVGGGIIFLSRRQTRAAAVQVEPVS